MAETAARRYFDNCKVLANRIISTPTFQNLSRKNLADEVASINPDRNHGLRRACDSQPSPLQYSTHGMRRFVVSHDSKASTAERIGMRSCLVFFADVNKPITSAMSHQIPRSPIPPLTPTEPTLHLPFTLAAVYTFLVKPIAVKVTARHT